ncbi:hypothetical protein Leryth_025373 [Lithospermum erythrorhizon]|nr:hypothetical protein Leryth_025373 [Lithospermum erythrorhizon]
MLWDRIEAGDGESGSEWACISNCFTHSSQVGSMTFQTRFQPHLVWTLEQIKKNIEDKTHQHLDARSQARC